MATILMHPTLSVRGRVFLQRASLAGRLAAGASPSDSPELARRAEQLRSPRNRRILATSLERVIDAAEEPPRPYSSSVPLRRAAILEERAGQIGLAAELRDTGTQVNVRRDPRRRDPPRARRAPPRLMDLVAIAIGLVCFAAFLALMEGLERV